MRAQEGISTAWVWDALRAVRDPELGSSIVDLGFVPEASVRGSVVVVRLRLPTHFCSPNAAFLMVADARDAALAVPGVERVDVTLEDHFAADQINAGVGEGRLDFCRKAHFAAMERACRRLIRAGWHTLDLPHATLADLPTAERSALSQRRARIGLPTADSDVIMVGLGGERVPCDYAPHSRGHAVRRAVGV